jgi:phosphatidylinositol alpha-1,6-mannosyltransferase
MRLLLVTNDYPPKPGGIQQYLGNLVAHYPYESLVLAPGGGEAPTEEGVARRAVRFMWPGCRTRDWVLAEARAFRPDLVLFGAPYPLPGLIGGLRRSLDVPYAVLCHGAEVTVPAAFPGSRGLLARTLRSADAIFAVSRFTSVRVGALTGREVWHLGGAVDVDAFRPGPPADRSRLVVGCVSRFVPRKGHARLIAAAAEALRRGRDIELLVVGRGRLEDRLRRLAARSGVPTRFEVGVPWSRLPDLYRAMDVFCMPCRSRWAGLEVEGLGLVYLEAAASGLPVLAGTSGGAPETVVPGETGYVVDDVSGIVEALELLADDPDRRLAMGRAGRARMEAEFTWEGVIRRLDAAFRQIVGDGRSGP